jgi:hypothetical protein
MGCLGSLSELRLNVRGQIPAEENASCSFRRIDALLSSIGLLHWPNREACSRDMVDGGGSASPQNIDPSFTL